LTRTVIHDHLSHKHTHTRTHTRATPPKMETARVSGRTRPQLNVSDLGSVVLCIIRRDHQSPQGSSTDLHVLPLPQTHRPFCTCSRCASSLKPLGGVPYCALCAVDKGDDKFFDNVKLRLALPTAGAPPTTAAGGGVVGSHVGGADEPTSTTVGCQPPPPPPPPPPTPPHRKECTVKKCRRRRLAGARLEDKVRRALRHMTKGVCYRRLECVRLNSHCTASTDLARVCVRDALKLSPSLYTLNGEPLDHTGGGSQNGRIQFSLGLTPHERSPSAPWSPPPASSAFGKGRKNSISIQKDTRPDGPPRTSTSRKSHY